VREARLIEPAALFHKRRTNGFGFSPSVVAATLRTVGSVFLPVMSRTRTMGYGGHGTPGDQELELAGVIGEVVVLLVDVAAHGVNLEQVLPARDFPDFTVFVEARLRRLIVGVVGVRDVADVLVGAVVVDDVPLLAAADGHVGESELVREAVLEVGISGVATCVMRARRLRPGKPWIFS
jgi:hypothetical protein